MSLFIIYVDVMPPTDRSMVVGGQLRSIHTAVRPRGPASAPRPGLVLTDGHSSERFLSTGSSQVGRTGDLLRSELSELLARRLCNTGEAAIKLVELDGLPPDEFLMDCRNAPRRSIEQFIQELPTLRVGDVRIVAARGSEASRRDH